MHLIAPKAATKERKDETEHSEPKEFYRAKAAMVITPTANAILFPPKARNDSPLDLLLVDEVDVPFLFDAALLLNPLAEAVEVLLLLEGVVVMTVVMAGAGDPANVF